VKRAVAIDAGCGRDGPALGRAWGRSAAASPSAAGHEAPGEPHAPGDAALAALAARGEPGAFARLYERHVDAVYRYVRFRVRDPALAEDLTHDVFVRALDGVRGLREPERFAGWLLRIAHNRVANHWRWRDARPENVAPGDDGHDALGRLAADPAPASGATAPGEGYGLEHVEARVDAARALAAAAALTDLQREVVALRFVAGLDLAETAAAMGRSVGAIKNLQHHALRALRDRLARGAPRAAAAVDDGSAGVGAGEEDDHGNDAT